MTSITYLVSALGILTLAAVCLQKRAVDWDHEQMSVTRSIAWETSHDR